MRIGCLGSLIVVVVAALVLAAMNPSESDFRVWYAGHLQSKVEARVERQTGARHLAGLAGDLTGIVARNAPLTVVRHNYALFSTFSVRLLGDEARYAGVAGRFFTLHEE